MVHQYKNNGYNIVLDVNSGAIHIVDDVTYDVIPLFEKNTGKEEIVSFFLNGIQNRRLRKAMKR